MGLIRRLRKWWALKAVDLLMDRARVQSQLSTIQLNLEMIEARVTELEERLR